MATKKVVKKAPKPTRTELVHEGETHRLHPPGQSPEEQEDAERAAWLAELGLTPLEQGQKVSQVELDLYLDSLLGHGRQLLRQYKRNRDVYAARKAELDAWLRSVQTPLERALLWLEGLVQPLIRLVNMGGKKSRPLPNGKVGSRTVGERVEITDTAAAVAFCKKHALAIKEEPYKKPILEWLRKNRNKLAAAEKAGITLMPPEDRTYWEVPEHKELKQKEGAGGEAEAGAASTAEGADAD